MLLKSLVSLAIRAVAVLIVFGIFYGLGRSLDIKILVLLALAVWATSPIRVVFETDEGPLRGSHEKN